MLNKHRIIHTKTFLHTLRDDANLLFKGCCSVLVKRWQIRFLVCGAESNGLCVALDGVLILASLEILVALVLCCLGPIQRALNETEREGEKERTTKKLWGDNDPASVRRDGEKEEFILHEFSCCVCWKCNEFRSLSFLWSVDRKNMIPLIKTVSKCCVSLVLMIILVLKEWYINIVLIIYIW